MIVLNHLLFPLIRTETLSDGLRLDGGQDNMVGVGDNDRPGLAPLGGVDEPPIGTGILLSLRMGALDGLTMEMTRSRTTKFPKPTLSNPCFCIQTYSMF